jgi:hypothetical protein
MTHEEFRGATGGGLAAIAHRGTHSRDDARGILRTGAVRTEGGLCRKTLQAGRISPQAPASS